MLKILFAVALFALLPADSAFAVSQNIVTCDGVDCNFCEAVETVNRLISFLLIIGSIIGGAVLMYGGWTMMSAGANEQGHSKGKEIVTNGVIGVIILFSAAALINVLMSVLLPGDAEINALQRLTGTGSCGDIIEKETGITEIDRNPIDPGDDPAVLPDPGTRPRTEAECLSRCGVWTGSGRNGSCSGYGPVGGSCDDTVDDPDPTPPDPAPPDIDNGDKPLTSPECISRGGSWVRGSGRNFECVGYGPPLDNGGGGTGDNTYDYDAGATYTIVDRIDDSVGPQDGLTGTIVGVSNGRLIFQLDNPLDDGQTTLNLGCRSVAPPIGGCP